MGAEVRCMIDDDLWRTQADRDLLKLSDLANEWREQFKEKGWQQ
jgi:hypothetical protein